MPTPETTVPVPATHVTPSHTSHALFGKVLHVIKEVDEWVVTELKDGIHDIEVKFKKADVTPVSAPAPAAPVATEPAAPAPSAPTPSLAPAADPAPATPPASA